MNIMHEYTLINIVIQAAADVAMTLAELGNKVIRLGKKSSANGAMSPFKWTAKQLKVTQVSLTTCDRRSLIDSFNGISSVRRFERNICLSNISSCTSALNSLSESILASHS